MDSKKKYIFSEKELGRIISEAILSEIGDTGGTKNTHVSNGTGEDLYDPNDYTGNFSNGKTLPRGSNINGTEMVRGVGNAIDTLGKAIGGVFNNAGGRFGDIFNNADGWFGDIFGGIGDSSVDWDNVNHPNCGASQTFFAKKAIMYLVHTVTATLADVNAGLRRTGPFLYSYVSIINISEALKEGGLGAPALWGNRPHSAIDCRQILLANGWRLIRENEATNMGDIVIVSELPADRNGIVPNPGGHIAMYTGPAGGHEHWLSYFRQTSPEGFSPLPSGTKILFFRYNGRIDTTTT